MRDIPVVQASGLVFASIYIGLNLLADVLSIICNPRLRNPT
jgi:peptide/nickel transport system permease protein